MLIITNLKGDTLPLIEHSQPIRNRGIDGTHTLSFSVRETDNNSEAFRLIEGEGLVELDDNTYRIKQIKQNIQGESLVLEVHALHQFFDISSDYCYGKINGVRALSLHQVLSHILAETGYTFKIYDDFKSVSYENFGEDWALDLFNKVKVDYGFEFIVENKHLKVYRQIGKDTEQQMRWKHNIQSISSEIDTTGLVTHIKGVGLRDEETDEPIITAEYSSKKAHLYDKIYHGEPVDDKRYTTKSGLLDRLKREINDEADVSYTIEYAHLQKTGIDVDELDLGDGAYLIHEKLETAFKTRVVSILDYPMSDKLKPIYSISSKKQSMIDRQVAANVEKKKKDDEVEGLHSAQSATQKRIESAIEAIAEVDNAMIHVNDEMDRLENKIIPEIEQALESSKIPAQVEPPYPIPTSLLWNDTSVNPSRLMRWDKELEDWIVLALNEEEIDQLINDMRESVATEGKQYTQAQIQAVRKAIESEISTNIGDVQGKIDALEEVAEALNTDIKTSEDYVKGLEVAINEDKAKTIEDIETLKQSSSDLLGKTTAINAAITVNSDSIEQKAEKSELATKVDSSVYSKKVGELTTSINGITGRVSDVETVTDTHTGQITKHTNDLANFNVRADRIESNVSNITEDVDGISENVAGLTVESERIAAEVTSVSKDLDGRIKSNASSITQTAEAINQRITGFETNYAGDKKDIIESIEKNTSAIESTDREIALRVTKEEFDNLSEKLSDKELTRKLGVENLDKSFERDKNTKNKPFKGTHYSIVEKDGENVIFSNSNTSFTVDNIPNSKNALHYFEMDVNYPSHLNGTVYAQLTFFKKNGATAGTNNLALNLVGSERVNKIDTWQKFSGFYDMKDASDSRRDAYYVKIRLLLRYAGQAGSYYLRNVSWKQLDSQLLHETKERIAKTEADIIINSDAIALKAEQSAVDKKVDTTTYTKKVGEITTSINGITQRVSKAETDVNSNTGEINSQRNRIAEVETNVDGITSTVSDLNSDLTTANKSISRIDQKADGITQTVSQVRTDLDEIDTIDFEGSGKIFRNLVARQERAGSRTTGALIIKTPITSSYMTKIRISGYNYVRNKSNIDLTISFYAYTTGILQHSYTSTGDYEINKVRVGRENGKIVIIINDIDSTWSYPSISVDEASIAYTNPPSSYKNGWSISFSNVLPELTVLTSLNGTDYKSSMTSMSSEIEQLPNAINLAVREGTKDLVGKTNVLSSVNLSKEGVKIQGAKIDIAGLVTILNADGTAGTMINGNKLITGSVTANELNVNQIFGNSAVIAKIQSDSIKTAKLSAGQIDTGTLNANNVSIINLSASRLTAGTIDANKITINNINASSIKSGKLTAINIVSSTITGGTINVDTNITVGNNIYLGAQGSKAWKYVRFNTDNNVSSNGDYMDMTGIRIRFKSSALTEFSNFGAKRLRLVSEKVEIPNGTLLSVNDGDIQGRGLNKLHIGSDHIKNLATYNRTYTATSQLMRVTVNGVFGRSTSSRRYKLNEKEVELEYAKRILNVKPKSWFDKRACEDYAHTLATGEVTEVQNITRIIGTIAEDTHDAGLEELVNYNDKGQPEGVSMNGWVLHTPLIQDLYDKNDELSQENKQLKDKLNLIESKLEQLLA